MSEEKKTQAVVAGKDKTASDTAPTVKKTVASSSENAVKALQTDKTAVEKPSAEPPLPPETEDVKPAPQPAQNQPATEPPLPPEGKDDIQANPVEADEIEKNTAATRMKPARRRGRGVSMTPAVKETNPLFEKIAHVFNVIWHSWLIKTGIVLALLCISALYLYLSLPSIVEAQLPKILAQEGIPLKSFKVKSLSTTNAELVNVVAVSGEVRIRTVRLAYSLSNLWNDHVIDTMDIIGMTMSGRISQQKVSFAGMERVFGSRASSQQKGLTINRLKISSGQLSVSRDDDPNPFLLNFDSTGSVKPQALNLDTNFSLLNERYSIRGNMVLDTVRNATHLKADIAEGNVLSDGRTVGSVTGILSVAIEDSRLTEGKANLSIETPEQTFAVDAVAVPHEDKTFSFTASFDRAFKEGVDAGDAFIGNMAVKADKVMFAGTSQRFSLTLPLDLDVVKATNGKISVNNLKADLHGKLNCTGGVRNCVYALTSTGAFSVDKVNYDGTFNDVSLAQPLSLFFAPSDRFLTFQKGMMTLSSVVAPFSLETDVLSNGETEAVSISPKKNSRLSLTYNLFTGEAVGSVALTGAQTVTPQFTSPVVNAVVNFTQARLQTARILAKDVVLAKKDIVAPFDFQTAVAPANADEYTLDAAFRSVAGRLSAKAKGTYNFRNDAWSLFVEAPKATFSEQKFPFSSVFPSLANRFDQPVEGTFALSGRLNIIKGKFSGAVKLLAMDFSTKVGDYSLQNVTTILNIVSLSPFETTDNQSIYIGQADVGIPFKNVSVTFKAVKEGLLVSGASAEYADANFRLIKPVLLPYKGASQPFMFDGQGISLLRLSELLNIPGLEVDAIGDAHLELTYDQGKFSMDNSVLFLQKNSAIGGMFKYNPPTVPASLDPKMLTFLQSVVFRNLSVDMNGDLTGKMSFDVMLDGYSSADEQQTPRNVSLQLEGSLPDLLTPDGVIPTMPLSLQRAIQETFK